MVELTTHGCGKSWRQRGDRTGHCGRCHLTFEGTALFDAHFERMPDGRVTCKNPAEMKFNKEPLTFDGTHGDGSWSATLSKRDLARLQALGGTSTRPADSEPSYVETGVAS